jgi:hypothetical protein
LSAIEFIADKSTDEVVTLDIHGAYLSYLLKDDILKYEFTITSPSRLDDEHYIFIGPVYKSEELLASSTMQYNSYLNRYISMNIVVRYDPFCIVIRHNGRDLLAPANTIDDALKIKEIFMQYLNWSSEKLRPVQYRSLYGQPFQI